MKFTKEEKSLINKSLLYRIKIDAENWKNEIDEIIYALEFENVYISRSQMCIICGCLKDFSKKTKKNVWKIVNVLETKNSKK